ncbi:MAG: hypothetical protein CL402_11365 [Acidiferrobacteraceae bacterium]|nr:hypothetical protein [Acidiferrobacteraceae bacterium]
MIKETIFMVVAILIASGEPEEVRTHPFYKFGTLEECTQFVQFNYQGLYTGLMAALAQEGSDKMIKEIACGEYDYDPVGATSAKYSIK